MNKIRIAACVKEIKKAGLDALLVADTFNADYLCGLYGCEGIMLVSADGKAAYFTNFLYRDEAKSIPGLEVICNEKAITTNLAEACKKHQFTKIGFEPGELRYNQYKNLTEKLQTVPANLIEAKNIILNLRAIKTPQEIKNIKKAIEITNQALDFAKEIHTDTTTEQQLSLEIERFMRLKGDNALAFPTIVASGKNSAKPHHKPGDKRLGQEQFLIDLGAKSCKYCADLTRVFFSSKMPPQLRKVYDIVRKAQEAGIKKIRPGLPCRDIDRAARKVIEDAGYGKHFGHGFGHGVGLEVHEIPYVGSQSEQVLKEGMVITAEPAIYLPGKFGIRIEDMVSVTSRGFEILSR